MDIATALPVSRGAPRHPFARNTLITLFFVAIMSTGVRVMAGSITLSLERVIGIALLPTLFLVALRTKSFNAARNALSLWFLWCLIETISAVFSSDFFEHFTFLLIAIIPTAFFAFLTSRRLDTGFINGIVRCLLWSHGVVGVAVIILHNSINTTIGSVTLVDGAGRLMLFVFEPNLYGSGIAFLILLALPRAKLRLTDIIMLSLAFATLLFARSKAPLLGFMIALVAYVFFVTMASKKGGTRNFVVLGWLVIMSLALLFGFSNQVGDLYVGTLQRADTIVTRSYFLNMALDRFYGAPVLGRGPGDFSLQNPAALRLFGGDVISESMWIWQMFVNIMHDSGLIGLLVYCGFLFAAIQTALSWIRRGSVDHCGYLAAFVSILVSSQAATVHLNAIFGIACGLMVGAPFAIRRSSKAGIARGSDAAYFAVGSRLPVSTPAGRRLPSQAAT